MTEAATPAWAGSGGQSVHRRGGCALRRCLGTSRPQVHCWRSMVVPLLGLWSLVIGHWSLVVCYLASLTRLSSLIKPHSSSFVCHLAKLCFFHKRTCARDTLSIVGNVAWKTRVWALDQVHSCCCLKDTALGQVLSTQGVAARHDQPEQVSQLAPVSRVSPVSPKLATTPDFGLHFSRTEQAEGVDT